VSAIEEVLWAKFHKAEPKARLGGILARKPGYHNSRDHLPADDYSVRQFSVDRTGPKDEGAGIDITFPDAQGGNYATIAKYSKRLMAAGKARDPRTVYMREFFGNTDSDRDVEGYDFSKERPSSSDKSHLWHIHISIHRAYINSTTAMEAILSILLGETVAQWNARHNVDVTRPVEAPGTKSVPFPGPCSNPYRLSNKGPYGGVRQIQDALKRAGYKVTVDGFFGPRTEQAVRRFQDAAGLQVDGLVGCKTWARLFR
jgi:hypothetical protein